MRSQATRAVLLLTALTAASMGAQEAPAPAPAPTPTPSAETTQAPEEKKASFLPLEGTVIINLPSVDVPRAGTLSVIFTHRFGAAVQNSSAFHDLLSFDSPASVGIGLGYTPIPNLDLAFYRSSEVSLDPWEIAGKYRFLSEGPLGLALRVGADVRSESNLTDRTSVFVQGILAYTLGERVRLTAVPTYVTKVKGTNRTYNPGFTPPSFPPRHDRSCEPNAFGGTTCSGLYRDVFNIPVGVSIALTRSITVHGEVSPRLGRYDSSGVAWIASVEKSLLRHRFSFTAGNQRQTTVDQYAGGLPWASQYTSEKVNGVKGVYLGFNLIRQWKVK
jgi:hypothetical protein